ncbi:MAG: sugar ABC transporter substrate-binding protein [Trueperaceae bacterium]|nr:sugar ABC transporter substrate-binding protein [Trueperaceae bacterium]
MYRYLILVAGLCGLLSGAYAQTTLSFWTISLSPTYNDYIEETLARFEAANPGITVEWRDLSGEAIGFQLLNAVVSGDAPDVVNINVPMLLSYAERGLLRDLEPLLDKRQDDYFANMLGSFRVGDELLGLPWYSAPPLLLYNREIFADAGLTPPPDTRGELERDATQITDQTGLVGFIPNIINQQMLYRFLEAGLPVLSVDGHEAVFDSPAHVAFLEAHIARFQRGYVPEDALLRGFVGALESYGTGTLGMLLIGPQFLNRLQTDHPDVYAVTEVAPYPLGAGGIVHAPLMGLAIPRASEHPQEGLELALFVTSAERQLAFSRLTTIFPSVSSAAQNPFFTDIPANPTLEDEARRLGAAQLANAADLTMELPNAADLFGVFQDNLEAAFFGYKSPRDALRDTVLFWNSRL